MIRAFSRWYAASLANRIAAAALGLSTLLIVVMGIVIFLLGARVIESNLQSALKHDLEIGADRITLRLNTMVRELDRFSRSAALVTALSDTGGRGQYLSNLLQSQGLIAEFGGALAVYNFRAEVIAENADGAEDRQRLGNLRQWVRGAIESGSPQAQLYLQPDGAALEIVMPVVLPFSGRPEGALVYRVGLNTLVAESLSAVSGRIWRLLAPNQELVTLGQAPQPKVPLISQQEALRVTAPILGLGLGLSVSEAGNPGAGVMSTFTVNLLIVLGGAFFITLVLSRYASQYLTRPIAILTSMTNQIAEHGVQRPFRIRTDSPDEVGALARGFSLMMDRINQSQSVLEERVRLRTEELRKAQSELEIRSQRLATILELSPDGFAEITPEQRIGFVNGAFEKITGMMATKISGVTLSDFTAQLSQLQEAEGLPRERWISVILENTKSSDELAVVRLRQPNDRVIAVGLYASGFSGRLIYVRDVTREAELDRMNTDFLSTAAHELRTPLASISGYSELLLKKQFESNQQKELLGVIHRHAQSMTALVSDLLEIVRAEARVGRNYLMQVQPITPLVRRVVEDFRLADDPRTPIQRLDEHLPAVLIDSERIRQVINNLLSNAVKYSEAGSPIEVATVIRQIDAAQWVGFRIKDYGIGMSQEEQAHLFERFYRANPQGPVPGTGLGMALIKEIIDQHRGKIEFDSALGKGSAVTVLFPAVTAAA